jgi:membrane fusion protein (multidrug efflux system)
MIQKESLFPFLSVESGAGSALHPNRDKLLPKASPVTVAVSCMTVLCLFMAFPPVAAPQSPNPEKGPPPALVEVAPVEEQVVTATTTLVGTGEPWLETVVASEESGLVSGMLIEEGDRVSRGQTLCEQDTTQLKLRIEAAQADLAEAKVLSAQAEKEWKRQKRLFAINSISEKAYEDAQFEAEAARNRVAGSKATLGALQDQLENREIKAPLSGYVVVRHCLVGQWLGEGEPVATLVVPDPILFRVPVPERYVTFINKGDPAQVTFDALPGRTFQGKIFAVIPRADDAARTFPVRIEISNADGEIKSGMLGRATLRLGKPQKALLVPKDALVLSSRGKAVYVVEKQAARLVPVNTGAEHGPLIEVQGDLQAGSQVVVRGNERLRPGQPLKIVSGGSPEQKTN